MKLKLKKKNLWIFTVLICLLLLVPVNVRAETQTIVSAESVTLPSGEEQMIPVIVQNGAKLMGFRLTIQYDPKAVTVTNVTAGKLTGNGLFNHNLQSPEGNDSNTESRSGKENSFDVVWSSADPLGADGEILKLYVKAQEGFHGSTTIRVTSTKKDTFDADFKEVNAVCKNIRLKIAGQDTDQNTSSGDDPDKISRKDGKNDVRSDRSDAKDSNAKDSDKKTSENNSKKTLDNKSNQKSDQKSDQKSEATQEYYKKEISDEILAKTDENEVRKIIDTAKEKYRVEKTADLTATQSREIFQQLIVQMEKEGGSASQVKKLYENVDKGQLSSLLTQIYDAAEQMQAADKSSVSVEKELEKSEAAGYVAVKVIVPVIVCAGIVVCILIVLNRKKKSRT